MDLVRQAGLYIHIPFCQSKCHYCSFFSFVPGVGQRQKFIAALQAQIEQAATLTEVAPLSFATLFFGGGTPSLLAPTVLAELLGLCRQLFSWSSQVPEISIEVNPGTIDASGLATLRQAGFNRLSIGIQSLNDAELVRLGRIHSREQALSTIKTAREVGFDNISCDLMYGLPLQSPASWRTTLAALLALQPEHLSLYELTLEKGTPFGESLQGGSGQIPEEEAVLEMMEDTQRLTAQAGLERYEISNYACPGRQCQHNCNYWHNGEYLGLGPGAVSGLAGQRLVAVTDLEAYVHRVRQGESVWIEQEQLESEAAFRETVVMGLRMTTGVSVSRLHARFGIDLVPYYGDTLRQLIRQDLLSLQGDRLFLTPSGLPLANRVMAELV
ncbi:radical SAM family heme chaperone HemW [Desulfobulbus rhabdoformis]|jgi:oxygen-independent coproporphyrinogen-3 oxidase|uniref:radical SAM family heme chaperone HemW n=1 Tax=Desulfobulbus rhabdoformis TaxID=34032 RepID=UPI0019630BD8|nr:radical SAM family heme chaperone HemW [Desulfobulbus rhabdoformis]MBM9612992.1 radical SAM family heme chaperone HemW [Desulfobulbus rhabdoformis]